MGRVSGKPGPDPGEGYKPRANVDIDVMRRAASIGCNADEIAALLGVARSTFYQHLADEPELQTALDEAREQGRASLRRMQWQRAASGDSTMLIWLGKNMLGQTDRTELTGKDGGPLTWVVRAPTAVESADEWLRLHAPPDHTLLESEPIPAMTNGNGKTHD